MTDSPFFGIHESQLGDLSAIEARAMAAGEIDETAVRHALGYLYLHDGPLSISRDFKTQAETHLDAVERFVIQWLFKRTDGKLRRHYGPAALKRVRQANYRCENCGYADVRALHIEKIDGDAQTPHQFVCLCANCQTVNARIKELEVADTRRSDAAQLAEAAKLADEAAADTGTGDAIES